MTCRGLGRIWGILARYDTEPVEVFIAGVTLLRGIWFLLFPALGDGALVYERPALSLAFVVLGAWWLVALAREWARARRWLALVSLALRFWVTVLVTLASPVAVNVPFHATLTAISVWLYVRLVQRKP